MRLMRQDYDWRFSVLGNQGRHIGELFCMMVLGQNFVHVCSTMKPMRCSVQPEMLLPPPQTPLLLLLLLLLLLWLLLRCFLCI